MINLTIRKKSKTKIAITTALFLLLCSALVSFAVAQDFQPPQIPNYDLPNEQDGGITIPSEPSNPGTPGNTNNITPAPTPEPQTDYGLMFFAIIIVAAIAGIIVVWTAWTISRKRKILLPPPPSP